MSVRKGDRSEGTLQVLNESKKVAAYTIQTCKQEKYFPKSTRWIFANRIVGEALDGYSCIRRANNTILDEYGFSYRAEQQRQALAHYENLLGLIELSSDSYPIDEHKIEYWTGLIVETIKLLKKWIKSDAERFQKIMDDKIIRLDATKYSPQLVVA